MSNKRVTSVDVARLANVSQSAVSRVFTPGASASEETRQKVLAAAKALGYRPNAFARSLITRRSRMIGLVVGNLDNPFYSRVIELLSYKLRVRGYHVLLFTSEPGEADAALQEILQYPVTGIVMASATLSSGLARECAEAGIPVVLLNREVAGSPTSTVASDNLEGGRKVARFLAAAGHRRIAFIAGDDESSTSRDREAGFAEGLAAAGQCLWGRAVGGYSRAGAAAAARALFAGADKPDALFVANDHMALAVMDTLREDLALSIPADVSVIGYDDVPTAAWAPYRLTTVIQPAEAMVDAAIDILFERLEDPTQIRRIKLPAELVVRGSTRR